jgi:hypothetical protein
MYKFYNIETYFLDVKLDIIWHQNSASLAILVVIIAEILQLIVQVVLGIIEILKPASNFAFNFIKYRCLAGYYDDTTD